MKEILKNLVESTILPEDSYLDQDEEILDIFVEEIEEIFEELDPLIESWVSKPDDKEVLATIRRHFHTLKGSGRMVGANSSGEIAWAVEDILNRVKAGAISLNEDIIQYVTAVYKVYKYKLYPNFKAVEQISIDLRPFVLMGNYFQQSLSLEPALEELLALGQSLNSSNDLTGLEFETSEFESIAVVDASITSDESTADENIVENDEYRVELDETKEIRYEIAEHDSNNSVEDNHFETVADPETGLLAETVEIFTEEAEEHLSVIDKFLTIQDVKETDYNNLIRAIHTLRGSSSMAHLDHVFDASTKIESLFKTLLEEDIEFSSTETASLIQYSEFIRDYLHTLQNGSDDQRELIYQTFNEAWDKFGFDEISPNVQGGAKGVVSQLVDLKIDRLLDAEFEFDKLVNEDGYILELYEQAKLLEESTHNKAVESIHNLAKELKGGYEALLAKPQLLSFDYVLEKFNQAHQQLIYFFDTLASGQRVSSNQEPIIDLSDLKSYENEDFVIHISPELQDVVENEHEYRSFELVSDEVINEAHREEHTEFDLNLSEAEKQSADIEEIDAENSLGQIELAPISFEFKDDFTKPKVEDEAVEIEHASTDFQNAIEFDLSSDELESLNDHKVDELSLEKIDLDQLSLEPLSLDHEVEISNASFDENIKVDETIEFTVVNSDLDLNEESTKSEELENLVSENIEFESKIDDKEVQETSEPELIHSTHFDDLQDEPIFELRQHVEEALSIEHIEVQADQQNDDEFVSTNGQTEVFSLALLSQRISSDRLTIDSDQTNKDFDEDLLDIFLEEAEELIGEIDESLDSWSKDFENSASLTNLMRYLHTLKGGANMIAAKNIGLITHNLESIYERVINNQLVPTQEMMSILRLVQDDVSDRIQLINNEKIDYPATETIKILQNIEDISKGHYISPLDESIAEVESSVAETVQEKFVLSDDLSNSAILNVPAQDFITAEDNESLEVKDLELDLSELSIAEGDQTFPESEVSEEIEALNQLDKTVEETVQQVDEDVEESIKDIVEASFREEAEELIETTQNLIQQWIDNRSDRSVLLQLQRAAHSLKGGARMAEVEQIATIAYQLESTFEKFAFYQFNSNAYDGLLYRALIWLKQAVFEKNYSNFDGLNASLDAIEYVDVTAQLPESVAQSDILSATNSFEFVQGDGTEPPAMYGEWDVQSQADNSNEMIRISADLVEKMIDLSGENSINRSRIEMELSQFGGALNEMELAIKRLADQLRRMEGELESQIIAKHGSENSRYADFDPLEMDQYSSLNQLSKSLAESTSDLVDFKNTLADKIRSAESLLLQQSRIQSEIQESLMRTRLVPFSGLLPRLQRIVRQTSSTLNRPTELVVHNTEGELDRTILERLVTPFEHMLRNAIDHGIEDKEERLQSNKPETGLIELNITRQGTDVVVTFSDDGKGIDDQAIKQKALKLGLITSDQDLDKQEILQLVFHPGFSTAKEVTQISGRGVGLDVVQSEIKALGGHVSIESTLGKGTTFTIRVPTTVAISDALMVKAGDQQFALPLAQIDRIVRIAPYALEEYFASQDEFFKIDNESYKLRYISEFVNNQPIPNLSNTAHSLPVLLIKSSAGQTIALLVDQLIGSRNQIVVKPIGQQFSKVGEIAGATILGDGQVCLILDSQNIARQIQANKRKRDVVQKSTPQRHNTRQLIMIVDDSVTVRKVTSRLLERHGYDVVTAKDGVDAVEQLKSIKPDLMLLDIEMPRMDGFEVTNHVRHDAVHRDLPIIMITSRTGEKHRERAFSLGVTNYMGKPFQEADLLEQIESLLVVKQG